MTDAMDTLVAELRAAPPPAPAALRARIEALAEHEPDVRPSLRDRLQPRRLVLITAPTLAAVMLGVAITHGVTSSGDDTSSATRVVHGNRQGQENAPAGARFAPRARAPVTVPQYETQQKRALSPLPADQSSSSDALRAATAPPPAKQRAQDYRASLTVRVDGLDRLSDATKAAIRATRAWGGYVVTANYAVPGEEGDSTLTLRIPVEHVQAAVQRFSSLGTLAAQDVSIRDVQGRINSYTRELLTINERIAKLRARLTRTDLTAGQRASLQLQLARAQRAAATLRTERTALAREASFATIALTLTTRNAAAAPHHDSRAERTLRDAGSILLLELAFGLFGLIVAAPLAVLAALAWLGARTARRRADDRLLGRA
jgi:hypothetical protein